MDHLTLTRYLREESESFALPADLAALIGAVAAAGRKISAATRRGALAEILGSAGTENVQGETQKKLDLIANQIMLDACLATGAARAAASEEMTDPVCGPAEAAPYLICFDPLDGSSNIDINAPIGTIFSVLPAPSEGPIDERSFLLPGDEQLAAGYVIYGPQTQLVLTLGRGTDLFTLDPDSQEFLLVRRTAVIPPRTAEFAINASNMRHWEGPVKRYIAELLEGSTGIRGKDYNTRWVASMVAEVHRILCRGGIFMYPRDARDPTRPGKLRLMYEANPMAWLVEQAGGRVTDGRRRVLSLRPERLHQRVAVFLGAAEEVELVTSYHGPGA